jgi:hypothetical protein
MGPTPRSGRRFTLLDAMVLVGATALALWVGRLHLFPRATVALSIEARLWSIRLALHWAQLLLLASQPMLAVWTLAVAALGLLPPRPPLRRLALRPGLAACLAAAAVIVIGGGLTFATTTVRLAEPKDAAIVYLAASLMPQRAEVGFAVTAVWLILALSGRWGPEVSWVGRAGRALGVWWIALIPIAGLWTGNRL